MLTSTESIGTPGYSAKEEMHMQIQLHQQQPPQHTIIFVEGEGPESVPKLEEPECCCGCSIQTVSIIMMIIHGYMFCNIIGNPKFYILQIIIGGMGLCYAGIAFCRTEQLCSIVSAVNHLCSIPMYIGALITFFAAYQVLSMDSHEFENLQNAAKEMAHEFEAVQQIDDPHVQEELQKNLDHSLNQSQTESGCQNIYFGIFLFLIGISYTYMAKKYQEFGEYLNKENKQ